jgi:hypothetical protein
MYIDEEDESIVMQKLSLLTKQAKEQGFNIGEIELKHQGIKTTTNTSITNINTMSLIYSVRRLLFIRRRI